MRYFLVMLLLFGQVCYAKEFFQAHDDTTTLINLTRIKQIRQHCDSMLGPYWGTLTTTYTYHNAKSCWDDYRRISRELVGNSIERCYRFGGGQACKSWELEELK